MKQVFSIFLFMKLLFAGFPDYYYKLPIKEQKKAFKTILLPLINKENQKILNEREKVKFIFNNPYFVENPKELAFLYKIAKKYKINDIYNKTAFLKKIDIIPAELILAQGAIESAWGKSYFAKKANNIFGQWDYSGNGMIPRDRAPNATHTVRVFKSLQQSLAVYMRNLNRNPAYREFRNLRYKYRKEHKKFSAYIAATTLQRYSQLGEEYVKILQKMIKQFKR